MAASLVLVAVAAITGTAGRSESAALFAIGPGEHSGVALARSGACGDLGPLVPPEELVLELAGTDAVLTPDEKAVERMLADARESEARFDSEGADALRAEILRTFERTPRPSEELRRLAAAAAHDRAATALFEKGEQPGTKLARTAMIHFAGRAVDSRRHPPAVTDLFERASRSLEPTKTAELIVVSSGSGEVHVDGSVAYATDGRVALALPPARYRVWFVSEHGSSLPRVVDLTAGRSVQVEIDGAVDRKVRLGEEISLDCDAPDCLSDMTALGRRLDVSRVIGVRQHDGVVQALDLAVATGDVRESECAVSSGFAAVPPAPPPRFTPLYLVPLGVGQFVQDRPVAGTIYCVAQVGLVALHIVAWQQHDAALHEQAASEPDLRRLRNISAGAVYASLAATVLEAVLVGLLTGR